MNYLSPVINHVHNKLNTHITLRLNGGRYSLPAKTTTKLDFDIMSLATGTERSDLFGALVSKYIAVDILVLKDGKYDKVGEYEVTDSNVIKKTVQIKPNPVKTTDIANRMGIAVKSSDDSVVKETTKVGSIDKVEEKEEPALDPVKEINKPRVKQTPKKEVTPVKESVLDNVKENSKEA